MGARRGRQRGEKGIGAGAGRGGRQAAQGREAGWQGAAGGGAGGVRGSGRRGGRAPGAGAADSDSLAVVKQLPRQGLAPLADPAVPAAEKQEVAAALFRAAEDTLDAGFSRKIRQFAQGPEVLLEADWQAFLYDCFRTKTDLVSRCVRGMGSLSFHGRCPSRVWTISKQFPRIVNNLPVPKQNGTVPKQIGTVPKKMAR